MMAGHILSVIPIGGSGVCWPCGPAATVALKPAGAERTAMLVISRPEGATACNGFVEPRSTWTMKALSATSALLPGPRFLDDRPQHHKEHDGDHAEADPLGRLEDRAEAATGTAGNAVHHIGHLFDTERVVAESGRLRGNRRNASVTVLGRGPARDDVGTRQEVGQPERVEAEPEVGRSV